MIENLDRYLVGGAVRDGMLGRAIKDRDWVVVGSSEQEMLDLGFVQVGRDFPVFLHPASKEEYALARTERKSGAGHLGFVVHADPAVTLEEDLARRDLTINAMARAAGGDLVDPFQGAQDLAGRVLRHVSQAFVEDPLRILRVARFAAQLEGFNLAAETEDLIREMCARGELATLSATRVWAELARALDAVAPERFFEVLSRVGGMTEWFPELEHKTWTVRPNGTGIARFVDLPLDEVEIASLGARLKIPKEFQQLAMDNLQYAEYVSNWRGQTSKNLCEMLYSLQVQHGDVRLDKLLDIIDAEDPAELKKMTQVFRETKLQQQTLQETSQGAEYGAALRAARQVSIASFLQV